MRLPFFLLAIAAAGCSPASASEKAPPPDPAVAVRLATVEHGPVRRPVRGAGVVRLKSEVDLSFKTGGVVASVLVDEGARVKKGQVLARLDPTEVDAALRQAKEGVAKSERDLDRVRRLHASGALPIAELQNAETALALARAGADAASFNAQRSAIVAPDDGRIDRRMVEPGEVVAPGRPVLHMSGRSKGAIVRFAVTDRDALRLHEGDDARVVLDARPDAPLAAKVSQLATVASPGSGTFDVEVKLDAAPEGLLSGLTAKITIDRAEPVQAVVPVGALHDGRGEDASLFVVADGRAKKRAVKVTLVEGGRAAILAGLDGDAAVVDASAKPLEDGTPVRVVR